MKKKNEIIHTKQIVNSIQNSPPISTSRLGFMELVRPSGVLVPLGDEIVPIINRHILILRLEEKK